MTAYIMLHTGSQSCFPLSWYHLTAAWNNLGLFFFRQMQCSTVELLQCETATVRYNKNLITYFFSHCDTYNFYSSTSTPPFHQLPSMSVNQTIRITFFVTSIVGEIINLRTNYAGLLNALVLQLIIVHTFLDRTESLYQWSMF